MYRFLTRPLRIDPMICGLFVLALTLAGVILAHNTAPHHNPVVADLVFNSQ